MAYPNDAPPKRFQVLEALKGQLEGIQKPGYHFNVQRVDILDSGKAMTGTTTPAVGVVVVNDVFVETLTCQADTRRMSVDLFGVLRMVAAGDQWKEEVHWFLSDMEVAIKSDIKIGSTAVFTDVGAATAYETVDSKLFLTKLSLDITYRHSTTDPTA